MWGDWVCFEVNEDDFPRTCLQRNIVEFAIRVLPGVKDLLEHNVAFFTWKKGGGAYIIEILPGVA